MNKLLKPNEIGVFALGGLGEVGKNMYIFEYLDQIFIIDSGILFPDDHLLGIDYVIPDYQYLIDNQEKIVGLFITHGHEDHIGGIPFLLKSVKIPKIYASGVAVDLIEHKLSEHKVSNQMIVEYKSHYKFNFKKVELSFIRMNHSIPDAYAFVFKTDQGTVIHSGDFKFDFTPVGPSAEYDKLASIGNEGVLCLLADSTNSLLEGFTESEQKVSNSLKELFKNIDSRIIVVTFASNIYRVQQIIEASIINNRKVAIFGRSMEKTVDIGQQVGYIKVPKGVFIKANEIKNYPNNEITLLCTGSQGEPLAALSRIANGSHKQIKQIPGDTVVFSSSPIPGNTEGINRTISQLFKNGANVITNSPLTDTHASGHAASGELKLMQALVKPKYFMSIHGEHRMLVTHANIAIECGVAPENTFVMDNGDVLALTKDSARIAGKVHTGVVYIDGNEIGSIGSAVIKERKKLSEDGLLSLILTIEEKSKRLILEPTLISRGFIYMKDSEQLTSKIINETRIAVELELAKQIPFDQNNIKAIIVESVSTLVRKITERNPAIIPVIMIC